MTQQPDLISFCRGLASTPELFSCRRSSEAACRLLAEHGAQALQYGPHGRLSAAAQYICDPRMNRYGITAKASNVFITTGSQQALDLIGKLLINPGDQVLVESLPTWVRSRGLERVPGRIRVSASDDHGLRTDLLEGALRTGPKFMYILPKLSEPWRDNVALDRRFDLVRLFEPLRYPAHRDDPYGALRYEGEHLPPLVALDADFQSETGKTAMVSWEGKRHYLGTFSKTLAPGCASGGCARRSGHRPPCDGQTGRRSP